MTDQNCFCLFHLLRLPFISVLSLLQTLWTGFNFGDFQNDMMLFDVGIEGCHVIFKSSNYSFVICIYTFKMFLALVIIAHVVHILECSHYLCKFFTQVPF